MSIQRFTELAETGRLVHESFSPNGYQQIATLSASSALTVPAGSKMALLQAESQNVRWRDDGTAPTATVGMLLTAGDPPFPYTGDLSAIRFIESAASAKLNIAYYG